MQNKETEASEIDIFFHRLYRAAHKLGLREESLGQLGVDPLLVLTPPNTRTGPHLLVTAGFHGDEPAGPWGVVEFLENAPVNLMRQANIAFLPLVNPTGFRKGTRENDLGQDPNRGFCPNLSSPHEFSREGVVLSKNMARLASLARDGCLALHEDVEQAAFYMYMFATVTSSSNMARALWNVLHESFEVHSDGPLEGGIVKDGLIFNFHDGSFEDGLFHLGVSSIATTETPGLADRHLRIDTNSKLISAFLTRSIGGQA